MGPTQAVLTQVDRLLDIQRPEQARAVLGQALRDAPDDAELLAAAARVEQKAGNQGEALRLARRAWVLAPRSLSARVVLFQARMAADEHAEAEASILELIRDYPEEPGFYAAYAQLVLKHLQFEKAAALVAEALRLDPEHEHARILRIYTALSHGRGKEALEDLTPLIRKDPESYQTGRALLSVLIANGRYSEALEIGRVLLRASPQDSELVEILIELKRASHWSMLPLRPFQKGTGLPVALTWSVAVSLIMGLKYVDERLSLAAAALWIAFVVYSWTYPPLLRRWFRRRGF